MKPAVLHGRNTGSFGFGLAALCGEKGPKLRMTTNTRWITCVECRHLIDARRAAAKARTAAL